MKKLSPTPHEFLEGKGGEKLEKVMGFHKLEHHTKMPKLHAPFNKK